MPVRPASPCLCVCIASTLRHLAWGTLACSLPAQQFTSPPNVGADGDSVVSSLQPFNTSASGRRFQYVVDDARAVPRNGGALINSSALRPDRQRTILVKTQAAQKAPTP